MPDFLHLLFISDLRRHSLHFSETPDLLSSSVEKKNRFDILKSDMQKNNALCVSDGIPPEVFQQFEKMNHKVRIFFF